MVILRMNLILLFQLVKQRSRLLRVLLRSHLSFNQKQEFLGLLLLALWSLFLRESDHPYRNFKILLMKVMIR